jgi:uridine kinase
MNQRPTFLGVAGGSGSGKTTVARAILEAVGEERIAFLEQDSYYLDIVWGEGKDPAAHNFDHPASLDNQLLVHHLRELAAGRAIEVPIYDFSRHRRSKETRLVKPHPVVLLEGLLLYVEPEVRQFLDFKIFVDTDSDIRLIRRLRRDLIERGRTVVDVLQQYESSVRPMHLEFVEPSKRYADVIIPEGGANKVALEMVVARVEQLLAERHPS